MTVKVVSVREADGGGAVILTFEISADGTGGESERRSLLLTLPQYRERRLRRGDTVTLVIPEAIGRCALCPTPVGALEAFFASGLPQGGEASHGR